MDLLNRSIIVNNLIPDVIIPEHETVEEWFTNLALFQIEWVTIRV
jgi:hypothetical protein